MWHQAQLFVWVLRTHTQALRACRASLLPTEPPPRPRVDISSQLSGRHCKVTPGKVWLQGALHYTTHFPRKGYEISIGGTWWGTQAEVLVQDIKPVPTIHSPQPLHQGRVGFTLKIEWARRSTLARALGVLGTYAGCLRRSRRTTSRSILFPPFWEDLLPWRWAQSERMNFYPEINRIFFKGHNPECLSEKHAAYYYKYFITVRAS